MKGDQEGFQKNRSLKLVFERKIDKIWFDSKEDSPSRADSRDKSLQVEITGAQVGQGKR